MPFTTGLIVRNGWLSEVNRRSQEFAGMFVPGEDFPNAAAMEAFVRTLPRPANAAEQTLLKARLLDLALRWGVYAHARYHGKHRCSCVFTDVEFLAGMKTEVVASEVGYRSKKSLFGALKRLTGLLPSDVRRLSAADLAAIVKRMDRAGN